MGSGMPSPHSTSITILSINIVLYLAMTVAGMKLGGSMFSIPGQVLIDFGAKFTPYILLKGEWWRLITAGFLHLSVLHILMNSWVLYDLIAEVEQFYGTARMVTVYVFSTFTGFFASMIFNPRSLSAGASAACFGLIGVMLAIGLRQRTNPLAQAIRTYYRRWAVYALVFSFLPGIDLGAHLGGLAGGFLFGLVAGLPGHPQSPRERFWLVTAVLAVAITVSCFILSIVHMMAPAASAGLT